ncbi:hypothetical protein G7046_g7306 [Stylonectria norvegica]|nr:hypothetical protein G7046_g7306 [Stylonectria norvegica]
MFFYVKLCLQLVFLAITVYAADDTLVDQAACELLTHQQHNSNVYFSEHLSLDFRDLRDDYFESDNWANTFGIQNWTNSATGWNKDDDASSDTFLTMRTMRLPNPWSAAEFDSVSTYHFLSLRVLARTLGAQAPARPYSSTLADGDALAEIQETDIEILTKGPKDKAQYTNQPSYTDNDFTITEATRNAR